MKFILMRMSDGLEKSEEINIKTLEDLMNIVKREWRVIITDRGEDLPELIIYDQE